MFRFFLKHRLLALLFFLALFIKLFSLNADWVERYYTYGFYPFISRSLRLLFGWLPFSFGDVLYFLAFLYLLFLIGQFFIVLKRRGWKKLFSLINLIKAGSFILFIYVVFQTLWGLNYSRQGIAKQLGLDVKAYSINDLQAVTEVLQQRLNTAAAGVDTLKRKEDNNNQYLFAGGRAAYQNAKNQFPFLKYSPASLKASLYSTIGYYFGFTGYYNPFSGEAQINTTVPSFLKPFVVTHEMAHQVGYAKENEANFVGFLACHQSTDVQFRYSVYFELYLYAIREVGKRDTVLFNGFKKTVHPLVRRDARELRNYLTKTDNKVEPFVSSFYDQYLKMNSQPKGMATYNEVIAWLIAYQKKYGRFSI